MAGVVSLGNAIRLLLLPLTTTTFPCANQLESSFFQFVVNRWNSNFGGLYSKYGKQSPTINYYTTWIRKHGCTKMVQGRSYYATLIIHSLHIRRQCVIALQIDLSLHAPQHTQEGEQLFSSLFLYDISYYLRDLL